MNRRDRLSHSDLSEYIRPITAGEREQLQQVLLEMYRDLLYICEKYGIIPYLCGGSALGAIRHQGFIPWDDDLDIAMTRADFNRLTKVFHRELSEKYILNAPNCSADAKARFPKIIKKGTVFQEIGTTRKYPLNGIFLDIFIIDNVPDSYLLRHLKGAVCNLAEYLSGCVYDYENLDEDARHYHRQSGLLHYYVRMTVGKLFSFIPSANWFHAIDKIIRWKNDGSRDCTLAQGRYHYFGEMLPREDIFPPRYCDFCGLKAPVFHRVEHYLENMYGDYMVIPPAGKRESHHILELRF